MNEADYIVKKQDLQKLANRLESERYAIEIKKSLTESDSSNIKNINKELDEIEQELEDSKYENDSFYKLHSKPMVIGK